jgi:protein SCO1/2
MSDQCANSGGKMQISTSKIAIAAAGVVIVGLGVAYLAAGARSDRFADCRTSVVAGGAGQIGGPFKLTDQNGKMVTDKDVLSEPALVYFGYTSCPDLCPTDMARNAEAVDILEEMGHEIKPVFISVDPRRDTPEVLKEWTASLHPRMVGLTGTPEQLQAAAKEYKTYFKVPENPTDEYYVVDHMTNTYLMLPGLGFAEFFKRDLSSQDLADRVACFLDAQA